jgi:hypothetical protein
MKRIVQAIVLGAMTIAGLQAQRLQADIPFDFQVASTKLQAGSYYFQDSGGVLQVRPIQGRGAVYVLTHEERVPSGAKKFESGVQFLRIDDHYALSKIWSEGSSGTARSLLKMPTENVTSTIIAATRTR